MASRMYDRWLAAATSAHHDQTGFAWQYGKAYMLCVDALTCELTATVAQMPAVIRHHTPWQDNRVCPDCKVGAWYGWDWRVLCATTESAVTAW